MLDLINNLCLSVGDFLLGWLLRLSPHLAIALVALGTSAILTFVRLFTTNQDLLRRCKEDKKRIRELMREARREGDKDARRRYRATMSRISGRLMAAEGKPLLASIVPIAVMAVWCFARLGYLPPRPGEPITVKGYFKVSAIGRLAHLVPREGLSAEEGWIKRVEDDPDTHPNQPPNGLAVWRLTARPPGGSYTLAFHCTGSTYTRPLEVGRRTYAPPLVFYDSGSLLCSEVVMHQFRPFGFVPGIPKIGMPPWLVAYLGIAVPFVFVLKWLFRIH